MPKGAEEDPKINQKISPLFFFLAKFLRKAEAL